MMLLYGVLTIKVHSESCHHVTISVQNCILGLNVLTLGLLYELADQRRSAYICAGLYMDLSYGLHGSEGLYIWTRGSIL